MAHAKTGGSRSFLKGKLANDVYSIGKDGKGKKQQVVRAIAESVENPRTIGQMRNRAIMATVMQYISGMRGICDHAFDGITLGQQSVSHAISQNYKLLAADVKANEAVDNTFALVRYQQERVMPGKYLVSSGDAKFPTNTHGIDFVANGQILLAPLAADTVKALRELTGLYGDSYITVFGIEQPSVGEPGGVKGLHFARVRLKSSVTDDTAITADNFESLFDIEGVYADNALELVFEAGEDGAPGEVSIAIERGDIVAYAIVLSSADENGKYTHTTSTFALREGATFDSWSWDAVMPYYPIGAEQFLNGGDL